MRRTGPRPVARALDALAGALAPAGTLAGVQACWVQVAGPVVGAEAEPVAEREGIVTVSCRSATWAQELELLSDELLERLNLALDPGGERPPVVALRFSAAAPVRRP